MTNNLKNSEKISSLIKNIEKQKSLDYSREVPLRYGFRIKLSKEKKNTAKQLNSLYESQLWGISDDANNQKLAREEALVIREWIKGTPFGENVLEVGCGSGRFTIPLLEAAKSVTAIDREGSNLDTFLKKIPKTLNCKIKNIQCDFASELDFIDKFSSIFIIENMIGMNPRTEERKKIIQNSDLLLMKHGLLFIGFRVHPSNNDNELFYQAMPYNDIYGISINWSVSRLINEVTRFSNSFKLIKTIEGSNRPAGGKMYIAIFQKS